MQRCGSLIRNIDDDKHENITALSRGTAILLLLVYGAYLLFQLKTHSDIYNAPSEKVEKRRGKVEGGDATKSMAAMGANISAFAGGDAAPVNPSKQEEEKEEPQLHIWVAVFTLAASTALVALCAEYMVDSINALCTPTSKLSKTFVGLILLPIVGNAAEHATAVTVACKDKMVRLIRFLLPPTWGSPLYRSSKAAASCHHFITHLSTKANSWMFRISQLVLR